MVKRGDPRKQVASCQDVSRGADLPKETQGQTDGIAVHSNYVTGEAREAALAAPNACMAEASLMAQSRTTARRTAARPLHPPITATKLFLHDHNAADDKGVGKIVVTVTWHSNQDNEVQK